MNTNTKLTKSGGSRLSEFIKRHEGLRLKRYLCPAGKPTIGWGHTRTAMQYEQITRAEAELLLIRDIIHAEEAVAKLVDVQLTRYQLDALISFVFNLGIGKFQKSTLRKKLSAGDFEGAAEQFDRWVYARDPKTGNKIKLDGLIKRRAEERALFEKGVYST